ncbi:MAG: diguanylate cyclase [Casimicrobiaceae bacterium]
MVTQEAHGTRGQRTAVDSALPLLATIAETLDSVGIATCIFDDEDRALVWNRAFLLLFPEHAGHIRVGEPYGDNLRRFYERRLDAGEMPAIDRYIEEGLARHRGQQRPFSFDHRGSRLRVASLPLSGVGRIRIWRPEAIGESATVSAIAPLVPVGAPAIDGSELFDHIADGVMVAGADHRILWVNEPFVLMYGLADRTAALGLNLEEAYRTAWHAQEAADAPLYETGLAILAENLRFAGAPFEMPLPRGRWTRVIEQRSPDGKGFFVHADITVLKRQQQQLLFAERRARDSEALLMTTLEQMDQGIMMVSAIGVVEVCNRRAIELLGLPAALMAAKPSFAEVIDCQLASAEFAEAPEAREEFIRSSGIRDRPHRYDLKRADGSVIEIHSVPIAGGGVLQTCADITDRRRSEAHIRHNARHDALTSLVNREVLLEHIADAVERVARGGARFAVHFIDLDRFKPVNDRFGHAVGDKVLALVAQRMRQVARDVDVVARLGGDEFAILQHRVDNAERALRLAHRVMECVAQPMQIESHSLQVGASVGIALFPAGGEDADTLLRNADAAMYEAKASGAGCARVFRTDAPELALD